MTFSLRHACIYLASYVLTLTIVSGAQIWVQQASNGKLSYTTSAKGDRILDYSYAGYGGGAVKIPVLPVAITVSPSGGDDTAAIQAAIDTVSQLPLVNNIRGAVLLTSGTFYNKDSAIVIRSSGVVVRGSGSGTNGTVIQMSGTAHTCLVVQGSYSAGITSSAPSDSHLVVDAYVPSGTNTVTVGDATGLSVGDSVVVKYLRTAEWIAFMGMNFQLDSTPGKVWMTPNTYTTWERVVKAIQGNRITLDVPLTDSSDSTYKSTVTLVKKTPSTCSVSNSGFESIRIVSPPPIGTLYTAVIHCATGLAACQDCWVRDIFAIDTVGVGGADKYTRRVTLQNIHAVHNTSVNPEVGYPASYSYQGQQVLFDRCSSKGDDDIFVTCSYAQAQLGAVVNCFFDGNGNTQPHMKWSTGMLVDSCKIPNGSVQFINRGTAGPFHGWAMGWGVAWNCETAYNNIQTPPGTITWEIGSIKSGVGSHVGPGSLYYAQLRERLGPPDCIPFAPKHRYSFSGSASATIADGASITDSIGIATAAVRGLSATYTDTGSGINLQGGASPTKAYIDLPNGVVTGTYGGGTRYTSATYEAWVTFNSTQSWARIFDFGTSSAGEVSATGGTFNGTDTHHVALSVNNNGTTAPVDRLSRNYPAGTTDVYSDVPGTALSNVLYHIVLVYDGSVKKWRWYRDGVLMQTLSDTQGLSTISDVNNWLGRSMVSTDPTLDGFLDEFRIYDYALTEAQIAGNKNAGPDKLNTISDSAFGPNGMSGSGVLSPTGTADTFNFDAQTLTGDFTVQTKLLSLTGTSTNALAGLMIREDAAANSRHAFVGLTPAGLSSFIKRITTGGSASKVDVSGLVFPQWLRLVRTGNNISAYVSADGTTWKQQGTTTTYTNLPSSLHVGLAVAGGTTTTTALAQFDEFNSTATTTNPTVVVTPSATATATSPITFTLTFSELVTGLTASEITVINGIKGALSGGGTTYTIPVTPIAQGAVTCQVPTAAAQGSAGNNEASNIATVTYDTIAPTVVVTPSAALANNAPIIFMLTCPEPVTGLTASDIIVTNGSIGELTGDGTTFAIPVTPSGQGAVTCQVIAAAVQDAAGNNSTASNVASVTYDSVPPSVTVTPSGTATKTSSIVFTLNFSEPVSGLTTDGITVMNGIPGTLSGSGTTYTLPVTATTQGAVTCQVITAAAQDAAGNNNTVSNTAAVNYDSVGPIVTISEPSVFTTLGGPVTYTVTYTDVNFSGSTLSAADIILNRTGTANGSVAITGSGAIRTVTIASITGNGTLGIYIATGTATDTLGNPAAAAGPSGTFLVSNTGPITKAATGIDLTAAAGWTGGSAPGSTQVAAWVGTSLGAGLTLATPTAWGGINVSGAAGAIGITGAGTLTLDAGGMDLSASTVNLTISNPIALAANQAWNVNTTKTLTASGQISGACSLTKTGAGMLSLSGISNFSVGLTIRAGTVNVNTAGAAGTGTITLGDSTPGNSNSATLGLYASGAGPYANNLTVAAGSSGTLTIISNSGAGGATVNGSLNLNNNVTINEGALKTMKFTGLTTVGSGAITINNTNSNHLQFTGGLVLGGGGLTFNEGSTGDTTIGTGNITGSGPLILNSNTTSSITVSAASINHTGSITNSGTGAGAVTISGTIGTNITSVYQNSPTSQLILSKSGNTFAGGLYINAGTVYDGGNNVGAFGTGTIYLGGIGSSASATLQTGLNATATNNPIVVQAANPGATLTIQMVAGTTSSATLPGDVILNHDLVLKNPTTVAKTLTLSGDIDGTGNLDISLSGLGNVTLSGASINHTGTITNSGTGTGTATISGAIGPKVTGIVQNSATSPMSISGTNTCSSNTTVSSGTLNISSACLAGTSTVTLATGANMNLTFTGNDAIYALYIDGVRQAPGTWGAIGSAAAHTTALITGTGMLNVADTVPPTVVVTPPAALVNTAPIIFTLNFSKPVTGLTAADIIVTNGSIGELTGDGTTFVLPITPSGQGAVTCQVRASAAQDAAGNNNTASEVASITYDSVPPSVTVTPSGTTTNTTPIIFTLTFSELVSGLTSDGIIVTNGTKGTLSGSGTTYTIPVTPTAQGVITCQIIDSAAQDVAGNNNTVSNTASVNYDSVGPVATIGEPSSYTTSSGPVTYQVTYARADFSASSLSSADITLNSTGTANGTVAVTGSGATRTVTIASITGDGTLGISIAAGTATDTLGNPAAAAGPSGTFLVSSTGPITKAATGIDLTAGAGWTGGITPGSTQVAAWAGTSLGAGLTLATSTSWGGISVTGASANISITDVGTLTLDAGGMNLSASTVNLTISNPIALAANQVWNVNTTKTLTASGTINGAFSLAKAGTGTLTMGGINTFTGGLTVKAGLVYFNSNSAAGTGTITLGDSTSGNSNTAELFIGGKTISNNLMVTAGSSGTLKISCSVGSGSGSLNGVVDLYNNLFLNAPAKAVILGGLVTQRVGGLTITGNPAVGNGYETKLSGGLVVNGGLNFVNNGTGGNFNISTSNITGSGSMTFNANTTGGFAVSAPSINHSGSIINSGTGTGTVTISGTIGTNVTSIYQNSATSQLTLSKAGNTFAGGLYINAGTVYDGGNNAGAFGMGVIYLGSIGSSDSATLQTGLISIDSTNPIIVQAAAPEATLTIQTIPGTTSSATLPGDVTLNHDLVVKNPTTAAKTLTLTGDIVGTGNINISLSGLGNVTLGGDSINHTGTITNNGTGTGTATISGAIGRNVTGIVQNSATSPMSISGTNTCASNTTVSSGTLNISSACLASTSSVSLATGATMNLTFTGSDNVYALYIDGVRQAPGTWGAIGSAAAHTTALITSTGILNVATGPSFDDWINTFTSLSIANRTHTADPNGDGCINDDEFILGNNPASSNKTPLTITNNALGFKATRATGTGYTGITRYWTVETTTDLANPGSWQPLSGYINIVGADQTVSIPLSNEPRRFYRLNVHLQ